MSQNDVLHVDPARYITIEDDLMGSRVVKGYPSLRVKRLDERAQLPTYGTEGAACFDLYALEGGQASSRGSVLVRTGLAFDIPEGWVMLVYSRSGHGFKHAVRLANCTGVIDSDYVGEVMVKLANDSDFSFEVTAGDRVAQAMLVPVQRFSFVEVDELKETERGEGGFGSTGK